MTMAKKSNRLREAINEMAEGMHRLGVLDDAVYQKITPRRLGPDDLPTVPPPTGEEIRAARE